LSNNLLVTKKEGPGGEVGTKAARRQPNVAKYGGFPGGKAQVSGKGRGKKKACPR